MSDAGHATGGWFISLEGPEGSGKSTQLALLAERLGAAGHTPLVTREPGGTATGERIRSVLLDPAGGPLQAATEALLFCAARAEIVAQVIRPALAAGRIVLCDRFADSTRAYQGHGRGLDRARLEAMIDLATGGLEPHLVLLLDLPAAQGLARRRREGEWNRLDAEGRAFHERVRAGFLHLAAADPARWRLVDASQPPAVVAEAVWAAVAPALAGPGRRAAR